MKNKKFVIDCKFGVLDYVSMVNSLANDYFDDDGTYIPHIGKLNAMRLFYNECIKEGKLDDLDDITGVSEVELIVNNDDFIQAFNQAIEFDGTICLNFANAYHDAIDIVDTRKNSLASAIEVFKGAMIGITDRITPVLSEDNLEKLKKIADDMSNGDLSADAIAAAYGNSRRLLDIGKKG